VRQTESVNLFRIDSVLHQESDAVVRRVRVHVFTDGHICAAHTIMFTRLPPDCYHVFFMHACDHDASARVNPNRDADMWTPAGSMCDSKQSTPRAEHVHPCRNLLIHK
jgi:hypothetical protein